MMTVFETRNARLIPKTTTTDTIALRTTWRIKTTWREMPLIRAVSTNSIRIVWSMLARSVRMTMVENARAIVVAGRNRCHRWPESPLP